MTDTITITYDRVTITKDEYDALKKDAEIGKLVRSKLIISNSISVSKCYIDLTEVEAIDTAIGEKK